MSESSWYCSTSIQPTRIAYLIEPDSEPQFTLAIQCNSLLWGGMLNPIIVVDDSLRSNPSQVEAFLRAYRPDHFMVMGDAADPFRKYYDAVHFHGLEPFHSGCVAGQPSEGVCSLPLLRRAKRTILEVVGDPIDLAAHAADSDALPESFWFGTLPEESGPLTTDRFVSITGGSRRSLNSELVKDELVGRSLTPLLATVALESRFRRQYEYFLLYRDDDLLELIDAWNVRALYGPPLTAIPARLLAQVRAELAEATTHWLSNHPSDQHQTLTMRCAGTSHLEATRLLESPSSGLRSLLVIPASTPADPGYSGHLDYDHCSIEIRSGGAGTVHRGHQNYSIAVPDANLIDQYDFEWGSVCVHIDFSINLDGDYCSLVLPDDVFSASYLVSPVTGTVTRSAMGWSCSTKPKATELNLRIPGGPHLVEWWFSKHGLSCKQSVAGRLAEKILAMSSGPLGVPGVCHAPALSIFERLVEGAKHAGHDSPKWLPRAAIEGLLRKSTDHLPEGLRDGRQAFGRLLAAKALVGGVEVTCTACGTKNFYRPVELDESLACGTCLTEYDLPYMEVDARPWRFRPQGPFAVPRQAQGGFAVACALSHLVAMHREPVAFMAGAEVGDKEGSCSPFDIDAVLFQQIDYRSSSTVVVFLECKHNTRFEQRDMDRASWLHKRFPDAILCFATLRSDLDDEERTLMRSFFATLKRCRVLKGARPLLVLTSTELQAHTGTDRTWLRRGGRWAGLAKHTGRWTGSYANYCVATQYLYLTCVDDENPYKAVEVIARSPSE